MLVLLALLALAVPAQAGTITLDERTWVFTAAPAERNDIMVESVPGGVRLTDRAAPPAGCPATAPNTVVCSGAVLMSVRAGDGDDRVRARGTSLVAIEGGSGDDVLLGDDEQNDLKGGPGNDRIEGRGGPDLLDGGSGRNVVRGGAGNDTVDSITGKDRLDGGPGSDTLALTGGEGTVLRCGAGRDTIHGNFLWGNPRVHGDCEAVESEDAVVRLGRRQLVLRCPQTCRTTVAGRTTTGRRVLIRRPVAVEVQVGDGDPFGFRLLR